VSAVTGYGLLFGAVVTVAFGWRVVTYLRRIYTTVLAIKVDTLEIRKDLGEVDKAVNGKEPGESSMVQQVQELRDAMPEQAVDQTAIRPMLRRIEAMLAAGKPVDRKAIERRLAAIDEQQEPK
jgi:hypothetical protein